MPELGFILSENVNTSLQITRQQKKCFAWPSFKESLFFNYSLKTNTAAVQVPGIADGTRPAPSTGYDWMQALGWSCPHCNAPCASYCCRSPHHPAAAWNICIIWISPASIWSWDAFLPGLLCVQSFLLFMGCERALSPQY